MIINKVVRAEMCIVQCEHNIQIKIELQGQHRLHCRRRQRRRHCRCSVARAPSNCLRCSLFYIVTFHIISFILYGYGLCHTKQVFAPKLHNLCALQLF